MTLRRILAFLVLAALMLASVPRAEAWLRLSAGHPVIKVDWQDPELLPRRFRNHCFFDPVRGRFYCADHCGLGYQFYYCSRESFGCCRVGFGYCDWRGLLRCAP